MDKKKLQDFLNKLQNMAEQLNDISQKETETENKSKVSLTNKKANTVSQKNTKVSVLSETSSENDLSSEIIIKQSDGTQVDLGEAFLLSGGDYITVEIDYLALLASQGYELEDVSAATITIWAKAKLWVPNGTLYSLTNNELIGDNYAINNLNTIDIHSIYTKYGNASFKFIANWSDQQTIEVVNPTIYPVSIVSLEVVTPPTKTVYKVGEVFDTTGMKINATYSNGKVEEITNFTVSPSNALSRANTYVTISASGVSVKQNIKVNRQDITCYYTCERRTRDSEAASWGSWQITPNANCCVSGGSLVQWRSTVKIDKSQIDMGNDEKVGLLLFIYIKDGVKSSDTTKHIRINGARVSINTLFTTQFFYVGEVNAGDTDTLEVLFEYDDTYLEFKFTNDDNLSPLVYFVKSSDPLIQKELKNFDLAAGKLQVNVSSGMPVYELTDIEADSTPLGIKLSHIIAPDEGCKWYGDFCNMNLNEHLDVGITNYNEYLKNHVYTDAYGNRYPCTVIFYYLIDGSRVYITDVSNINVSIVGGVVLGYTFNGHKVYIDYVVNGQIYTKEPSSAVLNNSYYKSVLADSSDAINLPVNWLRYNNIMKGFNSDGNLVLIIDETDNYTAIRRSSDGRIDSIQDKNGNYIHFYYNSNDKLSYIDDSRNRRIKYTYEEKLSNPKTFKLKEIAYCKVEDDGNVEEVYKTITLSYTTIKNRVLSSYGLSSVTSSEGFKSTITYIDDDCYSVIENISNYSTVSGVPSEESTNTLLSSLTFAYDYDGNKTTITDDNDVIYGYVFGKDGNLSDYYVIRNNKVSEYIKHEYTAYSQNIVKYAKKSTLNQSSLSDFSFEEGDSQTDLLNIVNKIGTSTAYKYTDNAKIRTYSLYSYDSYYRCNEKSTTVEYTNLADNSTYHKEKTVTNYVYDSETFVLKKQSVHSSHYEDSDEVKDKSYIKEYNYDSQGHLIENISYNGVWTTHGMSDCTCDFSNSDKFYAQYGYDVSGRLSQSKTQDGLYYDSYTYYDGTLNIKQIAHQGRGDLFYAYDSADRLTKVSATDSGLENSAVSEYYQSETIKLNHSGNRPIEFEYEGKRRISNIKLNGDDYMSFTYEDKTTEGSYTVDKVTAVNAKNESVSVVSDRSGSFVKVYYNSVLLLQNTYDANGYLTKVQDSLVNSTETYTHDIDGNVKTYSWVYGTDNLSQTFSYDYRGNVVQVSYSGTLSRTDSFTYGEDCDNNLLKIVTGSNSDITVSLDYDVSNRYIGAVAQLSGVTLTEGITYYKQGDHATNLPLVYNYSVKNGSTVKSSGQITFAYDESENIKSINYGGESVEYTYDSLGRLKKEENGQLGHTYTYTYDNNGNILTKKTDSSTIIYSYDGDKLISYNGQTCVYDALGNPTTYRGKIATWTRGKKLISYNGNSYTYDASGIRLSKNDIKFYYDSNGKLIKQGNGLEFYYDAVGVIGVKYNNVTYLCRKDLQGNIIALIDNSGNEVVQYKYDAWGNHVVVDGNGNTITATNNIGNLNPFRYRGYYYDTETGLYFLKSRYYDPEVGRFINMDSIEYADPESVNGINLYAYCLSNPVTYIDPMGHAFWLLFIPIIIGAMYLTTLPNSAGEYAPVEDYDDVPDSAHSYTVSNGAVIYYAIGESDKNDTELIVYNSYKYDKDQINEFLNYLKQNNYSSINIPKVRNEWLWHNLAYRLNISKDSTASVNVYLNADDEGHGFFSWIMNNIVIF